MKKSNQLWVQFSGGRFGFSVQRDIYVEVGGRLDGKHNEATWLKFADRVKWRKGSNYLNYSDYTFDITGAPGHLPAPGIGGEDGVICWWGGLWGGSYLASRTAECNL